MSDWVRKMTHTSVVVCSSKSHKILKPKNTDYRHAMIINKTQAVDVIFVDIQQKPEAEHG